MAQSNGPAPARCMYATSVLQRTRARRLSGYGLTCPGTSDPASSGQVATSHRRKRGLGSHSQPPTHPIPLLSAARRDLLLAGDSRLRGRARDAGGPPGCAPQDLPRSGRARTGPVRRARHDAACSLFGVPPGSLVGDSWETFALQPSIEAAAALRAALQQHGHGEEHLPPAAPGYLHLGHRLPHHRVPRR